MKSESIVYLFFLFCLVAIGEATMKSYKGYKVLSVVPTTIKSKDFLLNLMFTEPELDFWTEPSGLGHTVDIMVGPSYLVTLKRKLTKANINYNISVDNVQVLVNAERQRFAKANSYSQNSFNIYDFNNLTNIFWWLRSLPDKCPTGIYCTLYSLGKSFEGNHIYVFKINKSGKGRKAYWIDATIHAREWITTATILMLMNQLLTQGDKNAINLVQRYDWYFLPIVNPDGYAYTWTMDRFWRKNRRPIAGSLCVGTDLNRNFDFHWGKEGVSHDPCEDNYCGTGAMSEPETRAVAAELDRIGSSVVALVSLHSHAKVFILPWGNHVDFDGRKCEKTEDHDELMRVADLTADAIQKTYNTQWRRGTGCEIMYAVTGDTIDYAKAVSGIKYSYSAELRGTNFAVSPDQIILSYQELYNGIVAMVKAINS